jgi:hypothetical protein
MSNIILNLQVAVRLPEVPEHLNVVREPVLRQEGFGFESSKVSLADLTEEQLNEIAEKWKDSFLSLAKTLREKKEGK